MITDVYKMLSEVKVTLDEINKFKTNLEDVSLLQYQKIAQESRSYINKIIDASFNRQQTLLKSHINIIDKELKLSIQQIHCDIYHFDKKIEDVYHKIDTFLIILDDLMQRLNKVDRLEE